MEPKPAVSSTIATAVAEADYVHVACVAIPAGREYLVPDDPAVLAARVFDVSAVSRPVKVLFRVRQALVRLIGVDPAPRDVFAVTEVRDGEALISVRDKHLDFCAAVSKPHNAVRVITTVKLKGRRGRVYFAPVRIAHPLIIRAMIRSAINRDRPTMSPDRPPQPPTPDLSTSG